MKNTGHIQKTSRVTSGPASKAHGANKNPPSKNKQDGVLGGSKEVAAVGEVVQNGTNFSVPRQDNEECLTIGGGENMQLGETNSQTDQG